MEQKKHFDLRQPKIYVNQTSLGPHRQRVFELYKDPVLIKHTKAIWILASFFAGFILFGYIVEFSKYSVTVAKGLIKKEPLVYQVATTTDEQLLGSDDAFISKDEEEYVTIKSNVLPPKTSGLSFLVGDISTGDIILEKNADMILPIASVSKLLTAVVAKDELDMHKLITVTRSSINTYGTSGGLYSGEKLSVNDLFHPLLLESSNDAAEVIASGIGRETFMKKINEKAVDVGMVHTHLEDPTGLSYKNVSTAKDLFMLARLIDEERPEIWDITRIKEYAIRTHKWQNANQQLRKISFVGGKNGFTDEAQKTSVSVYEIPFRIEGEIQKQKRRIVVVVLKSVDREGDLDKLLRYVENNIIFTKKSKLLEEETALSKKINL
jgi:D-alanyl-D-alanine carboxypeptidase